MAYRLPKTTLLMPRKGKRGQQAGLLASFAFFALFACLQSRKAEMIRPGQEFELKPNQEAMIEGEGPAVVFESVLEDSRCPEGAVCVWSGNAKIRLKLSKQKQTPATVELNTNIGAKSSSYANYEIKLIALKPLPNSDKPVRPNEYIATLIVTKK